MKNNDTENKIVVLGKIFNSDEERRNYFHEELRKKLPELKKMEGFPIGDDEDILNLSDAPYYTACPNPWLNDFIAEWNIEQNNLLKKNIREIDFDVDIPFTSDISEGKYSEFYRLHPYHTKVPPIAILKYILHYTQPGDIILDGFAGTGMTSVAANLCENIDNIEKSLIDTYWKNNFGKLPNWGSRKAIVSDLSPIASFIAYNYNKAIDNLSLSNSVNEIIETIKSEFGWLYETKHSNHGIGVINYVVWSDVFECNNCNNEIIFWFDGVDIEKGVVLDMVKCSKCGNVTAKSELNNIFDSKYDHILQEVVKQKKIIPVQINYTYNNTKYIKLPDNSDFELFKKAEDLLKDQKANYPNYRMMFGQESRRNDKYGITHIHHFYFDKSLIILQRFRELCKNPLLMGIITTVAFRINKRYSLTYQSGVWGAGGGPTSGTLYIPSLMKDLNMIQMLEQALSKRVKVDTSKFLSTCIGTNSFTSLQLNDNSIDYIFLDPPFGSNLNYSELNFIWESWLKVFTNIKEEAIEHRKHNKTIETYKELLSACLKEAYRILKPGKWMTIEFSNTKASVWNVVQYSITQAGFVISNVSALDKQKGSFIAQTTPTAVKQDLVISCYKLSSVFDEKFKHHQNSDVGVWDFIEEHLNRLPIHMVVGNSTTAIIERNPKILYDRLISFYVQRNLPVPIDAGKFQQGLRERFIERDGMFFTNEQVQEYDTKKAAVPNFTQLSIFVASEQDSIYWLRNILEKDRKTESDLHPFWMKEVAGNMRKGDTLPEMRTILEENFLKDDHGKWYVPDPENEADLEKLRNKRLLKQFEVYKIEAAKPKGKIKEVRVEALRAGFKQCYQDKDFKTIVLIGDRIPNNLLMEDEVLLQFYDIANSRL
jgi:DNA modification methylase